MEYEPGCDVVVVNYRTSRDLEDFLRSFDDHTPTMPWTLTIANVEPGSEDKAVALMWSQKLADKGTVEITEYDTNVGYAHACNAAVAATNHEAIVLFNADIVLSADAIDDCVDALMDHDEWAVLGPRQVNEFGNITHAGIFGSITQPRHRAWQEVDRGQCSDTREDAISVSGSAYFAKRSVWDQLTNCERYRAELPDAEGALLGTALFYEEMWLSIHALTHGYRVVFRGETTIVHRWHQAVKQNGVEQWASRVMKESREMYRRAGRSHGIPTE